MSRLTWIAKLALTIGAAALGVAAVVAGVVPHLVGIVTAHEQEPVVLGPFTDLAQETTVYDSQGGQIARFRLERIQVVRLDEVPVDVVTALLGVEDKVFWSHKGVNLRSMVRAVLSNVSSGRAGQGASTITQQVVKNEYLGGFPKDARYKLLQARYATLLEKKIGKRAILERYLNTVYFGNNAYGISAAAETYFGKPVSQLNLVEGAFLAGLIRSPIGYDPIRRPEQSRTRFRTVMKRLAAEGIITPLAAGLFASSWPLPEVVQSRPGESYRPTYFTAAVRDLLLQGSTTLGDTVQERYNALYRGGLSIYTTLDPRLQRLAEEARVAQLPSTAQGFDTAIVSLDATSGAVRAMVGGGGYLPGRNEVNMALRPRQTGSSIKMFILTAALRAGAIAGDVIDGRRGCVLPNPGDPANPFVINNGVAGQITTLERATWSSLNCAFARLSQIVGLDRVVSFTHAMGVKSRLDAYASFATGANEISPIDMASGAQTLANRGLHHDPYYVERIVRRSSGEVIYQHVDAGTQVMPPEIADEANAILQGVLRRGTAARIGWLSDGKRPAAGKTGTQDNNTNAWFVGFTPQLSTAVWVGNPNGYVPMVDIPEFVKAGVRYVQGATFPARIWKAFMDPAHEGLPIVPFTAAPTPTRDAMLLFLPGTDCLARTLDADGNPRPTVAPGVGASGSVEALPSPTSVPAGTVDPEYPLPMAPITSYPVRCGSAPVPASTIPPTTLSPPESTLLFSTGP